MGLAPNASLFVCKDAAVGAKQPKSGDCYPTLLMDVASPGIPSSQQSVLYTRCPLHVHQAVAITLLTICGSLAQSSSLAGVQGAYNVNQNVPALLRVPVDSHWLSAAISSGSVHLWLGLRLNAWLLRTPAAHPHGSAEMRHHDLTVD